MLIAAVTNDDGKKLLVLGLEAENIIQLKNDMPIRNNLKINDEPIPGLEEWELVFLVQRI